jgi:quercetin dioxygenase-like cupin family protein
MLVIKAFESVDPVNDHRWMPDGDGQWFLPHFIDLKNNTYSGYWYANKHCVEGEHTHSGISFGTMLRGKILILCEGKRYTISKNHNFLMEPNVLHSAELIPSDSGFLTFGTVVGVTDHNGEKSDAKSYYDRVREHYLKQGIERSDYFYR